MAALLTVAAPLSAQETATKPTAPELVSESAREAAATVDAFHAALRRGDTGAAAALLADDALIFESGEAERSKTEYAAHHLAADAGFSRSLSSVVTNRSVQSEGDLAWVASEGRTTGTYKGKRLDLLTTETMALRHVGDAWRITHIHWSSAQR